MQNYIDLAEKNGIILSGKGNCQFCGANTERGIHECLEAFNQSTYLIDLSESQNHLYKFLITDAHTLQHSEIHGRWNNHLHLTRLHLIFKYNINWTYELTPRLSSCLNKYKVKHQDEYLNAPEKLKRGTLTIMDISNAGNESERMNLIKKWATEVYVAWSVHHTTADYIAQEFLKI